MAMGAFAPETSVAEIMCSLNFKIPNTVSKVIQQRII
jgi:hypothetical protein